MLMILLKSGKSLPYNDDFDVFFRDLMDAVINEALMAVHESEEKKTSSDNQQQLLLKEIMDNCILVSHQLLQISKENENLSKFIITGSLFQCAVMTFHNSSHKFNEDSFDETDDDTLH